MLFPLRLLKIKVIQLLGVAKMLLENTSVVGTCKHFQLTSHTRLPIEFYKTDGRQVSQGSLVSLLVRLFRYDNIATLAVIVVCFNIKLLCLCIDFH